MPEPLKDPVFCPVCDRPFKQADHQGKAMEYMQNHVELGHPEYTLVVNEAYDT